MATLYSTIYYVLSIYGISWIIPQSHLTKGFREFLWHKHFDCKPEGLMAKLTEKIAYLFDCIVCTGTWTGVIMAKLAGNSFLKDTFPPMHTLTDYLLIAGLSASTIWMLANKFDPDTE